MICKRIRKIQRYCRDEISKIENYEQAINDKENVWDCHHRLELTINGEFAHTSKELDKLGMYYNRPSFELIFMRMDEHRRLHMTKREVKEETKIRMSEANKGKILSEEIRMKMRKPHSEFGRKFKEHYGFTYRENFNLYCREYAWYRNHNKTCKWEVLNEI